MNDDENSDGDEWRDERRESGLVALTRFSTCEAYARRGLIQKTSFLTVLYPSFGMNFSELSCAFSAAISLLIFVGISARSLTLTSLCRLSFG